MQDVRRPAAAAPGADAAMAEVPAAAPLTLENVLAVWPQLAENESAPNLKATLSTLKPTLEGNDIHFEVKNLAQKDWIEKNRRMKLEDILRKALSNGSVRLIVDVAPVSVDDSARKLYMPMDKDEYLAGNSQEYRNLKTDFELEVK